MAIIVTPRTEAECNQLRSVLHSRGRNLYSTSESESAIKVDRSVITWGGDDVHYAVRDTSDSIVALLGDEHVPVNALYNRLRISYL